MGAAARLEIDARDLEQPHAALAARRRHRHGLDQLRPRVELRIGDPAHARVDRLCDELGELALDRVLHQALHRNVEIEMRLVLADAPPGDWRLYDSTEQMERRVQPHQPVAALPVELQLGSAADGRLSARLEDVQYRVGPRAFAGIEHAPRAEAAGVANLAA